MSGNIWLGLRNIHRLAKEAPTELHVYLEDFDGISRYAHYSSFEIADTTDGYRLTISGYSGTAGDSMSQHNQHQFTTMDSDNDVHETANCAEQYGGAWWYTACHSSNLNGRYYVQPYVQHGQGLNWLTFRGHDYSLRSVIMKVKRL